MEDYIINLNKTGNKYYEGTDIIKNMILYENACYDNVKPYNKYNYLPLLIILFIL